jgi:hypothetical protein
MGPLRYSAVPWLATSIDLRAYGEPETSVLINGGEEIAHGLHIPSPFGKDTDATLLIRATKGNGNDGGVITLAIGDAIPFEVRVDSHYKTRPALDLDLLGNPVRAFDKLDDNGANMPDGD